VVTRGRIANRPWLWPLRAIGCLRDGDTALDVGSEIFKAGMKSIDVGVEAAKGSVFGSGR
jgi:hypothetical protein